MDATPDVGAPPDASTAEVGSSRAGAGDCDGTDRRTGSTSTLRWRSSRRVSAGPAPAGAAGGCHASRSVRCDGPAGEGTCEPADEGTRGPSDDDTCDPSDDDTCEPGGRRHLRPVRRRRLGGAGELGERRRGLQDAPALQLAQLASGQGRAGLGALVLAHHAPFVVAHHQDVRLGASPHVALRRSVIVSPGSASCLYRHVRRRT